MTLKTLSEIWHMQQNEGLNCLYCETTVSYNFDTKNK